MSEIKRADLDNMISPSLKENILNLKKGVEVIAEKMAPTINKIAQIQQALHKQYDPILSAIQKALPEGIEQLAKKAREWQEQQKQDVRLMAENGWYPNSLLFFYHPSNEEINNLDSLMTSFFDESWDELTKEIINLCQNRKHILETAFKLHKEENYIASIPLFISQSDGICGEEFGSFFTKNSNKPKASEQIIKDFDEGILDKGFFGEILLEPLKLKSSPITQHSSKKSKGPSRHGILHGDKKHLNYGTKVNSYKALSFLAFIAFTTKEELKKKIK